MRGVPGRVWAIALNTFREAMRNRVLVVLALFAVGLMAFSIVLGELSLHEEVRVMKDIGLAGISLVGIVIALFVGVNLLSKELDRKTVYFVIPKPLHRWEFLVGTRAIWPFRVIWVLAVPFGAIAQLDFAWLLADTLNGLMAIPNLVSLLLLSPVVVKLTKEYFARS